MTAVTGLFQRFDSVSPDRPGPGLWHPAHGGRRARVLQADRMRLPTQRDRIVLGRSHQQVRLHLTTAAMHDRPFRIGPSLGHAGPVSRRCPASRSSISPAICTRPRDSRMR